ncbi:GntP family permease [Tsukamurella serpentis]
MVLAAAGVVLALLTLIVLAYRGHSVIVAAPVAALVGALFSGAPLMASYTQIFMPAAGRFIANFFPLFLFGAVFGALMSISGYADHLARWISGMVGAERAIFATAVATALLTYGGISAWVIAFTMVPIADSLFREANIPRRLLPAAIALGIFTFATAALPGSPQIHNAIPTKYFGTTTYAAPGLGIIGAAVTFGLGMVWLQRRNRTLAAQGEGYGALPVPNADEAVSATASPGHGSADPSGAAPADPPRAAGLPDRSTTIRGLQALLPVIVVVTVNLLFVYVLSRRLDFGYLDEKKYGTTSINAVLGVWSVTIAMIAAIVVIFAMKPSMFSRYVRALSEGARNAAIPVLTTASEVGFGAVVASLAVFTALQNSIFGLSDEPLVVGAATTAIISGLTGSSSGGLTITLETFGAQLAQLADEHGISPDLLHRVIAMASVSFDSLPHNGAIVTLLIVCGLTHRQSYRDIGMVTIIPPLIGVLVVLTLGSFLPTF